MGKLIIEIDPSCDSLNIRVSGGIITISKDTQVATPKEIPSPKEKEFPAQLFMKEVPVAFSYGSYIRKGRKSKGWTLGELGRKTGLSISYLSEAERDVSEMSIKSAKKCSDALGIKMADLFKKD